MRPEESQHFRTSVNASIECRKVLLEYYYLAKLPKLTEAQAKRLENILRLTEQDENISFLLNEIDEKTFQELGFYDDISQTDYRNEASMAQEHIMTENERKILMSFSTVRQRGHETSNANIHHPRMQMILDSTHSSRELLNRKLLLECVPENNQYEGFLTVRSSPAQAESSLSKTVRFLQDFLLEESISLLLIAALIGMVLLIFLP